MKYLIAVPCMSTVHTDFASSLMGMKKVPLSASAMTVSSLIYDARNTLASQAIDGGFDRILWIDSDMIFEPDAMQMLAADMDEGREYVTGLFFKRVLPTEPVIFEKLTYDLTDNPDSDGQQIVHFSAEKMLDYPRDKVFEVQGSGLAFTMMSVSLVKKVWDKYGMPFSPMMGFGEDLTFCWRVGQLGEKTYCDSRVKVQHIGLYPIGEDDYLAHKEQTMTEVKHDGDPGDEQQGTP